MKKISVVLALVLALSALPALAAGDDMVYGTMQIPYAEFYAAEGVTMDVDAVTSATNSKWKNEGLVAGTWNMPHADDEGGDIMGVVYPVAISQADLDALGENNFGFTALDEAPAAYKIAALTDEGLTFSAVQGDSETFEADVTIATASKYGDYQINVTAINNADGTSDIGTLYGVLLITEDGVYALRHLENIWRDNLAFGVGLTTKESHGNTISAENYEEMMGKTITAITYITETGYHTIESSLYVPVKFDGGVTVEDAPIAAGTTAMALNNLPSDYAPTYSVKGLDMTADGETITFTDALPGAYTLTVSDETGVYADVTATFTLTTDIVPVGYDPEAKALVSVNDDVLSATFIKNISKVTVGENTYSATGKGAVAIIDADGIIDLEAAVTTGKGEEAVTTPVFEGAGSYEVTVESTGFTQAFTFTLDIAE